ncbi:MAG: nucleotidyltransferase family protein [Candidatus Woesearchaeota archaeon]
MVSIVYMVAGMSSRFGGKIKQFAQVGPTGETLIEYSIKEAVQAGFDEIIFIVGNKTETPFKEMFGEHYNNIPVRYAKQQFDVNTRDKPWGTVDALLAAKDFLKKPFVICNGDDIYGSNTFKTAKEHLENNTESISIGYPLEGVLPEEGTVNRGMFTCNKEGHATKIVEELNITKHNFEERGYTNNSLASMNFFGFHPEIVAAFETQFKAFKEQHAQSRTAECLLPVELFTIISKGITTLKVLPTTDKWFGVTNPEDEAIVKAELEKLQD